MRVDIFTTQTPLHAQGKCSLACFISSSCALILSIFILCIGSFKRASAFYASPFRRHRNTIRLAFSIDTINALACVLFGLLKFVSFVIFVFYNKPRAETCISLNACQRNVVWLALFRVRVHSFYLFLFSALAVLSAQAHFTQAPFR